jgi:DNA-binding MurR/RpiR family transcriptional regulator
MKQNYRNPAERVEPRIRALLAGLSRSEARVAGYVLDHPDAAAALSVYELAAKARVSVASVSRFVRAAGWRSYRDFKFALVRDAAGGTAGPGEVSGEDGRGLAGRGPAGGAPAGIPMPSIYRAITPGDSDATAVAKVFEGYVRSLEGTLASLDTGELRRLAGKLARSTRVLFFGIGSSANVARDAALRFSLLNLQAEAYGDPLGMLIQAARLGKGGVAVGISHSGRSAMTCEALRIARAGGAVTAGISNYPRTPLGRHADHFFRTIFPEDRVGVAALSSRVAQLCVLDALYLLVARRAKKAWDIEGLNGMAERVLRVKA